MVQQMELEYWYSWAEEANGSLGAAATARIQFW
jgi:hypothetical protein